MPPLLAPGEKDVIEAIGRNTAKLGFKTGIRFVYIARKDVYSAATFSAMLGVMKQFNSLNLNGFKPAFSTSIDYFFIRESRVKYYIVFFAIIFLILGGAFVFSFFGGMNKKYSCDLVRFASSLARIHPSFPPPPPSIDKLSFFIRFLRL